MKALHRHVLGICGSLLASIVLHGQTYQFSVVGPEQGLTNVLVHALAQDPTGHLWIGTGSGVGRFDGRHVTMYTTADSLAEDFVASIQPSTEGSVWLGHNEGGITLWRNGLFKRMPTSGISTSTINTIIDDGKGGIWATAQNDGIIHVDEAGHARLVASAQQVLWTKLLPLGNDLLLAGADDGLHLFKIKQDSLLEPLARLDQVTTASIHGLVRSPIDGSIRVATDGQGILSFKLKGGIPSAIHAIGSEAGLSELRVKDMVMGESGQLVVATFGDGAYEIGTRDDTITSLIHYGVDNGLGTDNVSTVLLDNENSLWFACFGKGAARLLDRSIIHYAAEPGEAQDILAIASEGDDVWFGAHGSILHTQIDDMRAIDTLGATVGLPDDDMTALLGAADGALWAGTARSGLFHQGSDGNFKKIPLASDLLSNAIHDLKRVSGALWVATSNGVFVLEGSSIRHLTTENGLRHNQVNVLHLDRSGQVWMGCNNGGVSIYNDQEIQSFTLTQQSNTFHITGIAEDASGKLWFSTYGNGVWHSDGDAYSPVTVAQGLRSDYCYAIAADGNGSVWVTHRGGASRIDVKSLKVKLYEGDLGIGPERRMNTVVIDARRTTWFGTDSGVIRYDPAKDLPNQHPPQISITGVKVFDKAVDLNSVIALPPNTYRIEIQFQGISLKDPDGITYRYMLEGYDQGWTESSNPSALYTRLEDGQYVFKVVACSPDGGCSEREATIHFSVATPFWKEPFFAVLCLILLLVIAYLILRMRERSQRIAKELLQQRLHQRTRQLQVKQMELEAKNKDITDSITYARRIQQAILPSQQLLEVYFKHSFIIYHPRDIVSGDFYWFRRFGQKFILACADCTGHGVPGAFMSMIGSMLLREVTAEADVTTTDELLQRLDKELRGVLRYEGAESSNTDGMDISICEFDLTTRKIRTSAAMHDLFILRNGELLRERGTRRSIGGAIHPEQDRFEIREQQLEPGDRVYLFTDGIPDQFGGEAGKKLKVNGLMEWIKTTAALPMSEQSTQINERLKTWMEGHDQVDDMLLIAIEV